MAEFWSLSTASAQTGKDRRTCSKMMEGVAPDGTERGHPVWLPKTVWSAMSRYDTPAADHGMLDPAQERARKDRALAEATEMKNAVTRGELVSAADAGAAWIAMTGVMRERLLAMPAKLGRRLATMTSAVEVQSAIEAEVHTALAELADTEVVAA